MCYLDWAINKQGVRHLVDGLSFIYVHDKFKITQVENPTTREILHSFIKYINLLQDEEHTYYDCYEKRLFYNVKIKIILWDIDNVNIWATKGINKPHLYCKL